ncbi:FHA domain-containing protein [Hyphomicrobium sp. CS1GBMeth3]|uniref:FHA domain-containing protein n=1 Tax=Hyphomicrobium sp. CS1GBMeth3 TaxID=1892845 RepID=UPI001558C0E7|nr:FHA domain-containing protein [Hyphomicrobium sp. CS1GBMeth3]
MSRQHFVWGLTLRIAAGAPLFACFTGPVSAKSSDDGEFVLATTVPYWTGFAEWVAASYAQAPALVLGLAALVAVPPLALIGLWVARRDAASVSVSEARTQVRRVRREATAEPRDGIRTGHIPLRPLSAWVEVVNRSEVAPAAPDKRYGLAQPLLRIGRETDNDICLEDKTVHRYHAAIHRTEDAEFVITDLSSSGGNGVVVNGRAVSEARLTSGDLIELGNARLKFSAGPAGMA